MRSKSGAEYRIVIARPTGPPPAAGYPVIYVLDGNAWTALISEVIRTNLDYGDLSKTEPAVVVGIGYPKNDAFDRVHRCYDLTSPASDDGSISTELGVPGVGGDELLRDCIDSVVKPDVESNFPIDEHRQTLMGHSFGGLFTLRTLFTEPNSCQTHLALSPSIWWHNRALLADATRFEDSPNKPQGVRVFLSAGDFEEHHTPASLRARRATLLRRAAADPKILEGMPVAEWVAAQLQNVARYLWWITLAISRMSSHSMGWARYSWTGRRPLFSGAGRDRQGDTLRLAALSGP
jgi:predicted alpha/beta superfamily hydrolase